jgi:hypothetical protein
MAELRSVGQELAAGSPSRDRAIEQLAVSEVDRLIDPATPDTERQRRIHRLTEGPPEFVDIRLDRPVREKD